MFGYVMVPSWLLAKKPSANAVLAYIALATFGTFDTAAGVYEECRPALASLAERSGMSVSTVKRGLAELLQMNAISRTERWAEDGRTQLPSVYRVHFGTLAGPGGFTGERGGESTGEQGGGSPVSQNQEPLTQNQNTKKASPSARGTRLPEDWMPSEQTKAWCAATLPPKLMQAAGFHLTKFRNYWLSVPGAKGLKLNWERTFQNWMLSELARLPVSGAGAGGPKLFETMKEERAEDLLMRSQVADQLREQEPSLSIGEALELAKQLIEQHGVNALNASAPTGYIDAEEIASIDGPREVSGS